MPEPEKLDLSSNYNIAEISSLSGLINLEELRLGTNEITDITPLAPLTKMNFLHLSANEIKDISSLASLDNLERLSLDRNQISDIAPLLQNSGLGEGDQLDLSLNDLDLAENSEDRANIRLLEERGVQVHY